MVDRNIISTCCFSLGYTSISWMSRKQKSVALSTTEVEYIVVSMACCERGSYGIDTTFLCLSLSSICCSLIVAFMGCPGLFLFWLGPLFCGLEVLLLRFKFVDQKSRFFCFNFFLILTTYWYDAPSEEMSRISISAWMYFSRQLRYLSTICHSESLIQNFMHRV